MVFFWFRSQTQEQQKKEETQREEKKEKEEEKKKQLEKEKEETKKKKEEDLKKKMEEQKKTQGLFIEIFCRTAYLYLVPLAPVPPPNPYYNGRFEIFAVDPPFQTGIFSDDGARGLMSSAPPLDRTQETPTCVMKIFQATPTLGFRQMTQPPLMVGGCTHGVKGEHFFRIWVFF